MSRKIFMVQLRASFARKYNRSLKNSVTLQIIIAHTANVAKHLAYMSAPVKDAHMWKNPNHLISRTLSYRLPRWVDKEEEQIAQSLGTQYTYGD